ncbi:MAG: hypothetical protein QHG99_01295 [Methanomicrobiales archaeon]|nr:hypothetical protein [Methanomicrobiales archaeon]
MIQSSSSLMVAEERRGEGETDLGESPPPPRAAWSGTLSLGLINIPVKAMPLMRDRTIRFRMIHEKCGTPISFRKFCGEGIEVPDGEIVFGYEISKGEYVTLKKGELEEVKPESSRVVRLDSFIDSDEVDPHYFERTYILVPAGYPDAYVLLREVMRREGKGAIGRITMHSREGVVLVHHYRNALVATTLR